eukprot:10393315-Alexandrium_andersonii.AAC.1
MLTDAAPEPPLTGQPGSVLLARTLCQDDLGCHFATPKVVAQTRLRQHATTSYRRLRAFLEYPQPNIPTC